MSIVALLAGSALWILGLRLSAIGTQVHWRAGEYWWGIAAFTFGGIGTLASFQFLGWSADEVTAIRLVPLAAVGCGMVLHSMNGGLRLPGSGYFLLVLFAVLLVFGISRQDFLMTAASFFTLLPCLLVPSGGYSLQALRAGTLGGMGIFLGLLIVLAVTSPADMIGQCRSDKCSIWGESLGTVGTGNALGLFVALMGPITAIFANRLKPGVLITVGSYLLVDLTSSRSALTAWGIGMAVVMVFVLCRKARWRWPIGLTAVLVSGAVIVIPLWPWREGTFTGRSELWQSALVLFQQSPLFGFGSSYWVGQSATSSISANYATHNLLTEMLVSGGLVGAVCLGLALLLATRANGSKAISTYVLAFMAIWLSTSLTEVVSAPGRLYLVPGILAFILLVSNVRPGADLSPSGDNEDRASIAAIRHTKARDNRAR